MVGAVRRNGKMSAFMRTQSGLLFLVDEGMVVGSNAVRIEQVTDSFVEYSERVSDGVGNLVEGRNRIFIKQVDSSSKGSK
jgi:Tfp pilus assembly protein PilP